MTLFENGATAARPATVEVLERALRDAGVVFMDEGQMIEGGAGVRAAEVTEIDGRKFVGKQTVARRLIHAAIRNALQGECPTANQVVIGSALTLMREHAAQLGKDRILDFGKAVRPEFVDGMEQAIKSFYNFFKHANKDHDMIIDVSNMTLFNDLQIFSAIIEYVNLYGDRTHHMALFFAMMSILHPAVYNWELLAEHYPQTAEARKHFEGWSREQLTSLTSEASEMAPYTSEVDEDCAPLIAGGMRGYYAGPPSRDMFKRRTPSA